MMMETLNESFFVNVTTPAGSEPDTVSPFPSVDDESLISGNSIETEPESAADEDEDALSSDDDDSSEDESDNDISTSSDDSSAPPLPEDIGYVIDSNGVSLLANLNRKLLEHRYGKEYAFDKVPVTTKIDVDDAVDTMTKMQNLLKDGSISKEEVEMTVIPKSPSSASEKNKAGKNVETEKMIENLTRDDLQVLYKAVMGKDMPAGFLDSREEDESQRACEGRDDDDDENALGVSLPSILKESLSDSSASFGSSHCSEKKKSDGKKSNPTSEETVAGNTVKPTKKGFGFLKKLSILKKGKKSASRGNNEKDKPNVSTKATKKSKKKSKSSSSPVQAASSLVYSRASTGNEEREAPEERSPSPQLQLTEVPAPVVADIEEPKPQEEEKQAMLNACPIIAPETENKEESPKDDVEEAKEESEEAAVGEIVKTKEEQEPRTTEDINPTNEELSVITNSDITSVVCETNANGAEIQVLDDAIELRGIPHILPEVPVSPMAVEYRQSLAGGEKKIGRRFGKALRGKKSKSGHPSDEMLHNDDIKLTPENPVIEIPLSEMKPRKSLMSKYHEKKPKFDTVTSMKAAEQKKTEAKSNKSPSKPAVSPSRKKTSKTEPTAAKSESTKEFGTPETTQASTPKKKLSSAAASVSSKKSSKSSKSRKSRKSMIKAVNLEKKVLAKETRNAANTPEDDHSENNGFGSLPGYQDSDMESFEEAGGVVFCGMGRFVGFEQSITQIFDYCDHTPEEAYENTKVYEELSQEDESVNSRFSKIHRTRSSRSRGERPARSPGNRSAKSRSDKSTRSKSRSLKSVGEKSARSRSKARSDKSVGEKPASSRIMSVKSSKSKAQNNIDSIATKSADASSAKKTKKSSSQSTSGQSTKKVSNTTKATSAKIDPVTKTQATAKKAAARKADTKTKKSSTAKKVGKRATKKD